MTNAIRERACFYKSGLAKQLVWWICSSLSCVSKKSETENVALIRLLRLIEESPFHTGLTRSAAALLILFGRFDFPDL